MHFEEGDFRHWIETTLRPVAREHMVRPSVFDTVMAEVQFLPEVIDRQNHQKEFTLPIWDYLEIAASEERIRKGRAALRKRRDLFNRIEAQIGVESEVVAAIWGLESGYGAITGDFPTLSALATLGFAGRKGKFFARELICALRIIQLGHISALDMKGSWAGAMGHGQFMPSSFINFAKDFNRDGRADIWSKDPSDALASIANYLKKHGWKKGQPWGVEVSIPPDFDYSLSGMDHIKSTRDWHDLGLIAPDGAPLPDYGAGSLILPAGARGVPLLVLRNFLVILRYNRAEAYGIGIGHLADRIAGGKPFAASWPVGDEMLDSDEVAELQALLTRLGHSTVGVDGLRGPNTIRAARAFQLDQGLIADGYLSKRLLEHCRRAAA